MIEESRHWTRTERLPGKVIAIDSLDVRRVLMQAEYERRRPPWWVRLWREYRVLWLSGWW
jgi:hypothetical protein